MSKQIYLHSLPQSLKHRGRRKSSSLVCTEDNGLYSLSPPSFPIKERRFFPFDNLVLSKVSKDNFRAVVFQSFLDLNKHQMWTGMQRSEAFLTVGLFLCSCFHALSGGEVPLNSGVEGGQWPTLSFSVALTPCHLFYQQVLCVYLCIGWPKKKKACASKNPSTRVFRLP